MLTLSEATRVHTLAESAAKACCHPVLNRWVLFGEVGEMMHLAWEAVLWRLHEEEGRAAWASIVETHEALKGLEEDVQRTLRQPRDIRRSKEDDSMISSKVRVSSREVSLMISFPRSEKVAQYRLMKWKILLN